MLRRHQTVATKKLQTRFKEKPLFWVPIPSPPDWPHCYLSEVQPYKGTESLFPINVQILKPFSYCRCDDLTSSEEQEARFLEIIWHQLEYKSQLSMQNFLLTTCSVFINWTRIWADKSILLPPNLLAIPVRTLRDKCICAKVLISFILFKS